MQLNIKFEKNKMKTNSNLGNNQDQHHLIKKKFSSSRLHKAHEADVPVINYGVAISFLQGVLQCSLAPFPSAPEDFEKK